MSHFTGLSSRRKKSAIATRTARRTRRLESLEDRRLMAVLPPLEASDPAPSSTPSAELAPDLIAEPIQPPTFVVNSTGDQPDINPGDGACDTDGNPFTSDCTLRAAIMEANARGNLLFPDRITFDIPPLFDPILGIELQVPHTIRPNSPLPTVTDPVVIDATTQNGYVDRPLIQLDGTHVSFLPGLTITAGNSSVRGLAINRFFVGIQLEGGGGNYIQSNYIGTNLPGTGFYVGYDSQGNQLEMANGIVIQNSANNTIGGTAAGQGNLISGSVALADFVAGVLIIGDGATGNSLLQNRIGTNAAGTGAVANTIGVLVHGADGNTIGGTTEAGRNIISANNEAGVMLNDASANTVQGNFIGPDPTGMDIPNKVGGWSNGAGVVVAGVSRDNVIGGLTPASGNNISGNENEGIVLAGGLVRENVVQSNIIGITAGFPFEMGNGSHGVLIHDNAHDNTIGGVSDHGNIIAANHGDGVRIVGGPGSLVAGNRVQGNQIGNFGGVYERPNDGNGVRVVDAEANIIGGDEAGLGNIIAAHSAAEVAVVGIHAADNVVQGNLIGTNWQGNFAMGGAGAGVVVKDARRTLIGGSTEHARNLISGNDSFGVSITGDTAVENIVQGNYIGTKLNGIEPLPNGTSDEPAAGVYIAAPGNIVGGANPGEGNVISANHGPGVLIDGESATGNQVQGNFIGTIADGSEALGNSGPGAVIQNGAAVNTIGGNGAGARNVISGNGQSGVILGPANPFADDAAGVGNQIVGNYIGTTATGDAPLGNAHDGILILKAFVNPNNAPNVPATLISQNVVSDNNGGITVQKFGDDFITGVEVKGNLIGASADGAAPLGNFRGIRVDGGDGIVIGGTAPGDRNVVSGNDEIGIVLSGGTTGTRIVGNYIGTDATGTIDLGNVGPGVEIENAPGNIVGGSLPGEANVISGNGPYGVFLFDAGSQQNVVQGNLVGVAADGSPLGNDSHGVLVKNASNNTIGGTAAGEDNTIAHNGADGVAVVEDNSPADGNAILRNAIFGNIGLGIDLDDDGVTPNDAADADAGANNLQNFPVINSAATDGAQVTIAGTLESTANTTFRLEFFANTTPDPTGFGEGETFLGAAEVTTDAAGLASFSVTLDATVAAGRFATATATNLATNDTSEFSAGVQFASTPALSAEALLVQKLYRQVLHRDPEAAGWQYWTEKVAAGTASLGTIAAGIFESNERIDPIIAGLYRDYLGRDVETAGLQHWRGVWRTHGGPEQVIAGIVSSPEFFQRAGGTNDGWIAELYRRLLSREADTAGQTYWNEKLSSGQKTRQQVVLGFVRSDENFRNLAQQWYNQYLSRGATTEEEELIVTRMRAGASQRDIQIDIVDSDEYASQVTM